MSVQTLPLAGLDGVVAAQTALSHVAGESGELIIAGQRVGDLAAAESFEGVAARLLALASAQPLDPALLRRQLGQARVAAFVRLAALLPALDGIAPLEAMRAGIAAQRPVAGLPDAAVLLGAMPVLVAALVRQGRGQAPLPPDPALGQAADTLRLLRGEAPSEGEAAALDTYLVTVSDHGLNASTFTARVVASTRADLFMAVSAAYCALSGPLHGGAPGPVLDMLDAIGAADNIQPWIDGALARGERLMGFGHRIYQVRDPRAEVLREAVRRLGAGGADLGFAAAVEGYAREALARAKPQRRLDTNVEFYTAILLDALGIPREAFTPVFALARTAGWIAHALEQQRAGRLLRPASIYTGALPG